MTSNSRKLEQQEIEPRRLAAIDVGTNSFHLVVVKVLPDESFVVLNKEKIVVRLGESARQIKRLSEEAMERGLSAMKLFSIVAERMEAPTRAVATSAVREARNGNDFCDRVLAETGIEIEVVSGFEEARLIYLGVQQALPIFDRRVALVDIGGGSTEILVGEKGRPEYANSFKLGAIRMTQRFFPNEQIQQDEVESLRLHIRGDLFFATQEVLRRSPSPLVASSGTAQTVAAMALASRGDAVPDSLNGVTVSKKKLRQVVKAILEARTFSDRAALPGCDPRRADILAAGAIVLEEIVNLFGHDSFTISAYALREGIILDTLRKSRDAVQGGVSRLIDLRFDSIMKIGRAYDFDEKHGRHVATLAMQLYDQLEPLHDLPRDSRELLEAAALLHDIGYYISHSGHHKHAHYLIRNSELLGFNDEEIAVVANVARYHRKSHPKPRHADYAALDKPDQRRVEILAGILRIADGLDRTHRSIVRNVHVSVKKKRILINLDTEQGSEPTFEVWSVGRKKKLLEQALGREIQIENNVSVPAGTSG